MSPIAVSRFEVISPGLLTTFQDLGRPAMLKYALARCGAMDELSCRMTNLLLNNPEGAATLEVTAMGLELRTLDPALIAVGGADLGLQINRRDAPLWTVIALKANDTICFSAKKAGLRAYLAVWGGFEAAEMLGSCSVYLRGGMGAAFKAGDRIQSRVTTRSQPCPDRTLKNGFKPLLNTTDPIRVLPGSQYDYFTPKGRRTFTESTYRVSPVSDRQGIRTEGAAIERCKGPDVITDPIPPGAIQVPGDGRPIILMKDAQVTGGYTKIALVARVDMDRVGQLGPGDALRFQFITREKALWLYRQRLAGMNRMRQALRVRAKITSQNSRLDLGQIWSI